MLKAIRNFNSLLMLFIVSMVMVGFVADEVADSQYLAKHAAIPVCMNLLSGNVDIDDDDDDNENEILENPFFGENSYAPQCILETIGTVVSASRCPLALLRGQARRYSPRKDLNDCYNCTPKTITISGVDLFHATFFTYITQIMKPLTFNL